jgi:hypothetical protein
MGGGKGGSADASGMYAALASAQAAQTAYTLGEQNLQWAQTQWNQEQPMVQQVVSTDVAAMQQQDQFAASQQQLYNQTYQPLEKSYAQQAQQWASPGQQAINAGAAMTNVAQAGDAQRNSATQQLESFGVNPGSTRFAGLDIGSRTTQAAAEAGAGTTATQATLLQGLGLESGVINTGRGLPNTTSQLTATGTGAGSAAAGTAQSNISTGSNAMTAPANWFNTGAANMNTYVNAVNGYNQAQLGYAQVGAMQGMGMGSLAGGVLGAMGSGGALSFLEAGGPAQGVLPARNPGNVTGSPGATIGQSIPPGGTPGGAIPSSASPSGGAQTDDVPARLTVGEFVNPKDIVAWKGQEFFYKQIDKFRQEAATAKQRTDIGGQNGTAIPMPPTFISRPSNPAIPHARAV